MRRDAVVASENGETQDVPVIDNAYVAQVKRAFFPVRVVAYDADDREGRIVGREGIRIRR